MFLKIHFFRFEFRKWTLTSVPSLLSPRLHVIVLRSQIRVLRWRLRVGNLIATNLGSEKGVFMKNFHTKD
jgi:hypothetical protein